jgi:GH24 family phage-related lysozyme (muramidase)
MDNDTRIKLKGLLIQQEDLRLMPYTDITGNITIGVGRNLSVRGISKPEALSLLDDDIDYFSQKLEIALPWLSNLDSGRYLGVFSIAFNMGLHGLLGCDDLLSYLENKQWQQAHDDCLGLLAAKQDKLRYTQIASIFLTGNL